MESVTWKNLFILVLVVASVMMIGFPTGYQPGETAASSPSALK